VTATLHCPPRGASSALRSGAVLGHNEAVHEPAQQAKLDATDYYRLVRERIDHEDNLVVQRLSWMVAAQSFLFTAYAITVNGIASSAAPGLQQQSRLVQLIPAVGILSCALIYCSIVAATWAIAALRREFNRRHPHGVPGLPPLQSVAIVRWCGLLAPLVLPLVFIAAWLCVLTR
jgi:hypothetical protein